MPHATNNGTPSPLPENAEAPGLVAEVRPRTENPKGILATAGAQPRKVPALREADKVL